MKISTNDLCGKLADNPDSTGNNQAITDHKHQLVARVNDVCEELHNLTYGKFKEKLENDKKAAGEYQVLFDKERKLQAELKKLSHDIQEEQDNYTKECEEANQDI